MARVKPSTKAKNRASMLQSEVALDANLDPEMKKTLRQERGRRVGFKKSAEALNSLDPNSRNLLPSMKKKRDPLEEVKSKIKQRKSQNEGARYLKRSMGN